MQKQKTSIAIVNMAGIFPKAPNLETFWQNIVTGTNAISDQAFTQWDADINDVLASDYEPDKALHTNMGLMPDFTLNTAGLNLEQSIIDALDPMHRLLLQTGQQLFQNTAAPNFNRATTGFILASIALPTCKTSQLAKGVLQKELQNNGDILLKKYPLPQNGPEALGTLVTSAPAALFAQAFGLGGINYTLDAACASSLFAVKLACDELIAGRADAMLAGGLSKPDSLYTQIGFTQLKALSKSGKCSPFDAKADGLIVGEGCGMVLLKRLDDAIAAGDEILAVISAVGTSNDMDGTLLAPASEGQVRAMRKAYQTAGLNPGDIDLIECHGAGTPLGDKTELLSLSQMWQNTNYKPEQCALSSVKSMTGHLLTAAGMAGLIKTVLAMRNSTIPPSLNFSTPPPNTTTLTTGPFYVPTKACEWLRRNAKTTRKAAVSAFGFGGTNAHLLLEEWDAALNPGQAPPISINTPEPVVIVGIGIYSGTNAGLDAFRQSFLQNAVNPANTIERAQLEQTLLLGKALPGMYVNKLTLGLTDFHITPNELADILPQHLMLMQAAREAMLNAGLDLRADKPSMGALVGMDFALNANNFCVRWLAHNLNDDLLPAHLNPSQKAEFKAKLADYYAAPLTHNRVLGNLGGIIAARLAKEFRLGALCSTISCGEISGLRALSIAVNALQNHEADNYLAAAVDFTGDPRNLLLERLLGKTYSGNMAVPFDKTHAGTNPGDAAVCLALKRLSDAKADNNRIYAVLNEHGESFDWQMETMLPSSNSMSVAIEQIKTATAGPIELVVTTADANTADDNLQVGALTQNFTGPAKNTALASLAQTTGNTGAAAGLLALAASALCLYHKTLPGVKGYTYPAAKDLNASALHVPQRTLYWAHNHAQGPRTALCSALSKYGHTMQWLLCENDYANYAEIPAHTKSESALALALTPVSLFTFEGDSPETLNTLLQELWLLNDQADDLNALALKWQQRHPQDTEAELGLAFIANTNAEFDATLAQALKAVQNGVAVNTDNLWYNPEPKWQNAKTVMVFPGSGNQFLGMGRDLYLRFPNLRQQYDFANRHLKDELTPQIYMPYLSDWSAGYQQKIWDREETELLKFIFGQTAYSVGMYQALTAFEIKHEAVAGYSLGESAAMFATGTWNDAYAMMTDMEAADLFKTQLFGPCLAFRKAFNVPQDYPFKWSAVWLNCAKSKALEVIKDFPYTTMMIVDTADECVIGGDAAQIKEVVARLNCHAVYLHGVSAVHCKGVEPIKDEYQRLHTRKTTPNPKLTYYSCGFSKAYEPTAENVGKAMLQQILYGFDFTKLAEQMYADGYRVFIEPGPGHSLARILGKIYGERPHLALSASKVDESENLTLARLLGRLVSERIHVNLAPWFANIPEPKAVVSVKNQITLNVYAEKAAYPQLPKALPQAPMPVAETPVKTLNATTTPTATSFAKPETEALLQELVTQQIANNREIAAAHEKFLELSAQITQNMAQALQLKMQMGGDATIPEAIPERTFDDVIRERDAQALYPRALCLEFARGLAQNVLGPEFADVDTYEVRVRLPDEPLMLADRIMEVNAAKGVLGPGSMITEHDVKPDAWYLDGGHAPVCIAVEAGQADLFLSAYMGIDKVVKGKRAYRLLDAVVEFHRELPVPGEIIAYHINIERFLKHGETYIFFFNFTGYINGQKLITMTKGCAGFFTKDEVENSGGILPGDMDAVYKNITRHEKPNCSMAPMEKTAYDDVCLDKLRYGHAADCFGPAFAGIGIPPNLQLAKGQMHLLDRILEIDPHGGRWGLGSILGEAHIDGDEWFLECHFVDDKVMPGTLMYECCAHTLKVFLQRMGWLSDKPEAYYGTMPGIQSKLKCRGPVTPSTKKVTYAIEIKEIGLTPNPYVLADAFMFADGHQIVWFQDMPMQLCHATWDDVQDFWQRHAAGAPAVPDAKPAILFDRQDIEEFCVGSAAKVFGDVYAPFDNGRYMARLPKPPFLFIDRIVSTAATPFKLETGHKFVSEFDIKANDWYFAAEHNPILPTVCLMEIALQPCGFSTVYMGTALLSEKGLHFRNLSGDLTLYKQIEQQNQTLIVETTLTKVVKSRDMILVSFDFALKDKATGGLLGDGQSTFGFFPKEQLANQKGFATSDIMPKMQPPADGKSFELVKDAPLLPEDPANTAFTYPAMPAGALSMVDRIDSLSLNGGSCGLGFVAGSQTVNPEGWFFDAHFPGDPVCPGSLGVDGFMQLLKAFMLQRFPNAENQIFRMSLNSQIVWDYRGQILRHNKKITMMVDIIALEETPHPKVTANAVLLADGVHIYTAKNLGLELIDLT